ncbi:unnamed protein product [Lactuca saligna]|uniref:Uncharacterized protein n=1 Tax=Lactuca saligna TaxID=75948 RepID=A0AA35ZWU4_LACSI|nr:unnamed protein product [Lactuca saligna]
MDVSAGCCVLGVATVIMFFIWRVSNLSWFVSTKKLRKHLKDQGLNNSSNKCMSREGKEMAQTKTEAKAKQFSLTRDMAPRVSPFFYRSINTHEFQIGKKAMCIEEPKPNLDTLIKRLRSKQSLHNVIPLSNAQIDNKTRFNGGIVMESMLHGNLKRRSKRDTLSCLYS